MKSKISNGMKFKKIFKISILVLSFLLMGHQALASNTNGTIDPTYRYAWGENVGFIDFGSEAGNVHITDSSLSGSIYGENIGWIDLSTITNDNEGNLSGYAWGENVGFIDFGQVIIDDNGIFTSQAYGENIGFITFNTNDNNKVTTDWRPESTRRHSSGGSSVFTPPITPPTTPTLGCSPGNLFNTETGQPCAQTLDAPGCSLGNLFNTITGVSCGENIIPPIIQIPNISGTLRLIIPRMTGNDVKDLQNYLNSHSYNAGLTDGIFGTKTKQAVVLFQLANGLKGDGVVGPLTRALLK